MAGCLGSWVRPLLVDDTKRGGATDNFRCVSNAEEWASPSPVTEVGTAATALDALPSDLATLRAVSRQLVFHYEGGGDFVANGIAADRIVEIDTRYADAMFSLLEQLGGPISPEPRLKNQRLIGCCRDYAVMFVAMARHKGIPARIRVGFATYFDPGWFNDHVIAEVWDDPQQRWRLVEPEIDDDHVAEVDGSTFDPLDVPNDKFVTGPRAWLMARHGDQDAERFVVAPDLHIPDTRGFCYLRHNLIHDLAALNKTEMLLWDEWGLMDTDDPLNPQHLETLDELALATSVPDPSASDLRSWGTREEFRVPSIVTSESAANNQRLRVDVRRTLGM